MLGPPTGSRREERHGPHFSRGRTTSCLQFISRSYQWPVGIYYLLISCPFSLTELRSSRSVGSDDAYSRITAKSATIHRQVPLPNGTTVCYRPYLGCEAPAELVQLGCQFNIPKFFICGFKLLLEIPLKQINKAHRHVMGNDVLIALVYAKSLLEEHTRIVACEEPVILAHSDDCPDPVACQEDWHQVWWNEMIRFLLDGRNPQPSRGAVKRFRELQFGRMGSGCQKMMFRILDGGVAFQHADVYIAHVCNELVDELHLTDL